MQRKEAEIDNELFLKNELDTNKLVIKLLLFYVVIFCLLIPLSHFRGFLDFDDFLFEIPIATAICVIPIAIFYVLKNNTTWMKYLLIISLVIVGALSDGFFSYYAWILMICPVFISSRYYSVKFTIIVAVFTLILYFIVSVFAYYGELNTVGFSNYRKRNLGFGHYETLVPYLATHYFIKSFLYVIPMVISILHANNGRRMVRKQASVTNKVSEIQFEFLTAEKVQQHVLPNVAMLSEFDTLDVSVMMKPAKQTAGDFYDFFKLDDNTLVIMVADVSDKGLPAAMLMMEVKHVLHSLCMATKDLQCAVNQTNATLCQQNIDCMFVTMWIGFIDLTKGKCSYINAGHVSPIIVDQNGVVKFVENEPQPIVGAVANIQYKVSTFDLLFDETLFLYTDGVTDAINCNGDRFEIQRLVSVLKCPTNSTRELCENVLHAIRSFSQQIDQFDDITMLAIKNRKDISKQEEKTVPATHESIAVINDWILSNLQAYCKIEESNMLVMSAVDDILSNIVDYAYEDHYGYMTIRMNLDSSSIVLSFIDSGVEFNPLNVASPNLNDMDRVGGLGIYLIKNLLDDVRYEYVDKKNILTVVKRW